MSLTPNEILGLELPRRFRGYDEEATDQFLERAAKALGDVLSERDTLRKQLVELQRAAQERDPQGLEQIGDALLTAHRASERLLAEAQSEIGRLGADAERERRQLLLEAQAAAAHELEAAHRRLAALRHEERELATLITTHQTDLVHFVREAISRLAPREPASGGDEPRPVDHVDEVLHERVAETRNGSSSEDAVAAPATAEHEERFTGP